MAKWAISYPLRCLRPLKAFDRDQTIYGNIKVTSDAFIGAKTLFYGLV